MQNDHEWLDSLLFHELTHSWGTFDTSTTDTGDWSNAHRLDQLVKTDLGSWFTFTTALRKIEAECEGCDSED
jgi:hypothetical protein